MRRVLCVPTVRMQLRGKMASSFGQVVMTHYFIAAAHVSSGSCSGGFDHSSLIRRLDALEERCHKLEAAERQRLLVEYYASMPITNIDMEEVVQRCRDPRYSPYVFSHKQLPILLAHVITKLSHLPGGLAAMPSVVALRGKILSSFLRLADAAVPSTVETQNKYEGVLADVVGLHEPATRSIAQGLVELRHAATKHRAALGMDGNRAATPASATEIGGDRMIRDALDGVYDCLIPFSFIGRQLLALPHQQKQQQQNSDGKVGLVDTKTDLEHLVLSAANEAKMICEQVLGDAPDCMVSRCGDLCIFPLWADAVRYLLVEVVKNSLRATVEYRGEKTQSGVLSCASCPPVTACVAASANEPFACVCISDEGGGIPRGDMQRLMAYGYTTVSQNKSPVEDGADAAEQFLSGFGFGLPLARAYARWLGGDITLQSIEGFGTNAYIHLKRMKSGTERSNN